MIEPGTASGGLEYVSPALRQPPDRTPRSPTACTIIHCLVRDETGEAPGDADGRFLSYRAAGYQHPDACLTA